MPISRLQLQPQKQNSPPPTDRMDTANQTLLSLQHQLINIREDEDQMNNFRSLAATVFWLEDCLMEDIED